MSLLTSFLLGFIFAASLSFTLAAIIYIRARRRVRKIQTAIIEYQKATKAVNTATSKVFEKTQRHD